MEENLPAGIQMAADDIAAAYGLTPKTSVMPPSGESAEKNAQAEVAAAKAEEVATKAAAKTA